MLRVYIILIPLLVPVICLGGGPLPEPRQISEHAWAWIGPYGPPTRENRGFRMNLGFVLGDHAVAVIDSGYGGTMAEAMLVHIRKITDKPVRYVINTNSQPHRIMGNPVYRRAGAEVIAAGGAFPRIEAEAQSFATTVEGVLELATGSLLVPDLPSIAVKEELSLDLGSIQLHVIPVGDAHTPGSLVVAVDVDSLVFAGDVLYSGRLLSILSKSHIGGWIDAFEKLRRFDYALFVPGHGEPGPLSAFEHSTYDYLRTLKKYMDQAVEEGMDLQDAIGSIDQSGWNKLADFDALAGRNAHQAYLQSEAAAFE